MDWGSSLVRISVWNQVLFGKFLLKGTLSTTRSISSLQVFHSLSTGLSLFQWIESGFLTQDIPFWSRFKCKIGRLGGSRWTSDPETRTLMDIKRTQTDSGSKIQHFHFKSGSFRQNEGHDSDSGNNPWPFWRLQKPSKNRVLNSQEWPLPNLLLKQYFPPLQHDFAWISLIHLRLHMTLQTRSLHTSQPLKIARFLYQTQEFWAPDGEKEEGMWQVMNLCRAQGPWLTCSPRPTTPEFWVCFSECHMTPN